MLYQGSAFRLETTGNNILKIVFDLKDQSANVFNTLALKELGEVLEVIKKQSPRGLLFTSGKPGGFVFGADVTEFLGHFKKTETEAIDCIESCWRYKKYNFETSLKIAEDLLERGEKILKNL